jgi:hypothetical protein
VSAATELADRIRRGQAQGAAGDVLELAADATDYQHALVHMGVVPAVDEDGAPSDTCQACGEQLARPV